MRKEDLISQVSAEILGEIALHLSLRDLLVFSGISLAIRHSISDLRSASLSPLIDVITLSNPSPLLQKLLDSPRFWREKFDYDASRNLEGIQVNYHTVRTYLKQFLRGSQLKKALPLLHFATIEELIEYPLFLLINDKNRSQYQHDLNLLYSRGIKHFPKSPIIRNHSRKLIYAALTNQEKTIKEFLGQPVYKKALNDMPFPGITPNMVIRFFCKKEIINLLPDIQEKSIDLNHLNHFRKSELTTFLIIALAQPGIKKCINKPLKSNGDTLLHLFFRKPRNPEILNALLASDADVNAQNYQQERPLHITVLGYSDLGNSDDCDFEPSIQVLLKAGAKVNVKNNKEETPLQIAVFKHKRTATQLLLKANANIKTKNSKQMNLLHQAAAVNDLDSPFGRLDSPDIIEFLLYS